MHYDVRRIVMVENYVKAINTLWAIDHVSGDIIDDNVRCKNIRISLRAAMAHILDARDEMRRWEDENDNP